MSRPAAGAARTRGPSRRRRIALLFLVVLGAVSLAVPPIRTSILILAGRQLVAADPVAPADLVVIGPDAGAEGVLEAADLVREGSAHRVAVLGEPLQPMSEEFRRRGVNFQDTAAQMADLLRQLGVDRVDLVRLSVGGTEEAGRVIPDLCVRQNLRTVIVVTGADHSRRFRRVLQRTMRGKPAAAIVRPSRYSPFVAERWWQQRDTLRRGIVELEKLLLDVVRHPLS